jgi:hypothetical protein
MIDFDETVSYPILFENMSGQIDTGLAIIDSFGMETLLDGKTVEVQYLHVLHNGSVEDEAPFKVYKNVGFVGYTGLLFPSLGTGLCDVMESLELRCYTDGIDTLHFTPFDCYEITLGSATKEIEFKEIMLSPNPAADEIFLPDGFLVEECWTILGQLLPFYQAGDKLDIRNWPSGMCFLKLRNLYTNDLGVSRIIKY